LKNEKRGTKKRTTQSFDFLRPLNPKMPHRGSDPVDLDPSVPLLPYLPQPQNSCTISFSHITETHYHAPHSPSQPISAIFAPISALVSSTSPSSLSSGPHIYSPLHPRGISRMYHPLLPPQEEVEEWTSSVPGAYVYELALDDAYDETRREYS